MFSKLWSYLRTLYYKFSFTIVRTDSEYVHNTVMNFISILKGKQIHTTIQKDGDVIIGSGTSELIEFIFSNGDCGRFAYLLAHTFSHFHPTIYKLVYDKHDSDKSYHYLVKIRDNFYDIHGWKNAKEYMEVTKEYHPNSVFIKDGLVPEEKYGNVKGIPMISEIVITNTLPMTYLVMEPVPNKPGEFTFDSVRKDRIAQLEYLFKEMKCNGSDEVEKKLEMMRRINDRIHAWHS